MLKLPLIFIFLLPSLLFSQDKGDEEIKKILEGHSYHGEAFNEGPRSAAYLMDGTGEIKFPVTTDSEMAQKFFLQGVGQLHGFWYFEAERSFRQAALHDPQFAMAYWGMSLANLGNKKRALEFLAKAYEFMEGITEREKMYLDSLAARMGLPTDEKGLQAYRKDKKNFKPKKKEKQLRGDYIERLEKIIFKYPDDLEAKALLVLNIWSNSRRGYPINSHIAVNSLAQEILRVNPFHPTHHYLIHLWDKKKPEMALDSAAKCGPSAPDIAHMWHMPGHIYSRLHRYADAAWQQEASARTDHRHMMNDLVLPDQIHNFAHNNEWLCRNLMNLGRVHDALSLSKNMSELPRHPKYNTIGKSGSARYGRQRIFQCLNTFEMWDEALELKDSPYLEATDMDREKIRRLRLLARANYEKGNFSEGDELTKQLQQQHYRIKAEAIEKVEKDQSKKEAEAKKKKKKFKASKRSPSKNEEVAGDALYELRLVKALNQGSGVNEILAKRKDLKGIDRWVQAQSYLAAKNFKKAIVVTEKALDKNKNKVVFLARYIYVLFEAGKIKEAQNKFDELRAISEDIDLGVLPFIRLTAAAAEFGYPEDWRMPHKKYTDIGKRPDLESLGPFRWRPVKSREFNLPDHNNKKHKLSVINQGQPVLLIFYLGASCLHCVEQLNAFAPVKEKYEAAGIKVIAVSTEKVDELKSSVDSYSDDGTFPFQIFCDPELKTFKKYRCYDDFEKMALHGTFLIDRHGFIRWQDISYEPFMKPDFLLEESQRLLSQPEKLIYGKEIKGADLIGK